MLGVVLQPSGGTQCNQHAENIFNTQPVGSGLHKHGYESLKICSLALSTTYHNKQRVPTLSNSWTKAQLVKYYICLYMYICICLLFIKKEAKNDLWCRYQDQNSFLPNKCPDRWDRGKLCPGLTAHYLAFLNLREKLSLCLTSLARLSQNSHGRRRISMQHYMDIWHPTVAVPPGSWTKVSLGARIAGGCHGTRASEDMRSSHAGLNSASSMLVPQSGSESLPGPQQQVPGHVGGVSWCPGSERNEVGSRFSCCLQAWKLLISKKERSNCVVSTFESREEGDHSVKWGNYSLVACVGQSACLLSNT